MPSSSSSSSSTLTPPSFSSFSSFVQPQSAQAATKGPERESERESERRGRSRHDEGRSGRRGSGHERHRDDDDSEGERCRRDKKASKVKSDHPSRDSRRDARAPGSTTHTHRSEDRRLPHHREHRNHRRESPPPRPSPHDALESYPHAVIDRFGDKDAARYERPDASRVPAYSRLTRSVLGLAEREQVDFDPSAKSKAQERNDAQWEALRRDERRRGRRAGGEMRPLKRRRIDGADGHDGFAEQSGYIALSGRKPKTHGGGGDGDDDYGSSEDSESDSASPTATALPALDPRVAEMDARARRDPHDVEAWLALAAAQTVDGDDDSGGAGLTSSRRRSHAHACASVQLAILDRAVHHNRDDVRLGLARVRLASLHSSWDVPQLQAEWERLLRLSSRSATLSQVCTAYLSWQRTSPTSEMSLFDLVGEYRRCMTMMSRHIDVVLRIQLDLCCLLRDAGYPAWAFAILQAQLEIAMRDGVAAGDEVLREVEALWDSEEPRLGDGGDEDGSETYSDEHSTRVDDEHELPASGSSATRKKSSLPPSRPSRFTRHQRTLTALRCRPARTDTVAQYALGEGEVDPYAVIFWQDVSEYIVSAAGSADAKDQVVWNMLRYLGLPSSDYPCIADCSSFWPRDSDAAVPPFDVVHGQPMERAREAGRLSDPQRWPRVFALNTDDGGEERWRQLLPLMSSSSTRDTRTMATLLRQLDDLHGHTTPLLRVLRLALANLTSGHAAMAQLAKQLLSTHAEDCILWRAYAAMESRAGNAQLARRVYRNVLASDASADVARDVWWDWFQLELTETGMQRSPTATSSSTPFSSSTSSPPPPSPFNVLVQAARFGFASASYAPGDTGPSVVDVLKARRFYSSVGSDAVHPALAGSVWFAYLSQDNAASDGLTSALTRWRQRATTSTPSTAWHRIRVDLIWYHLQHPRAAYRPIVTREALLDAARFEPTNTRFLAVLAAHESRFRLDGVIRRVVSDVVLRGDEGGDNPSSSSFHRHLTAIYLMLHINGSSNWNVPLVRSLFERAVDDAHERMTAGQITTLWRLYLSFEMRVRRSRRGGGGSARRVKDVLYRSLAACPWDRELYLRAFDDEAAAHRIPALSVRELVDVGQTMDQKGLRVYAWAEEWRRLRGTAAVGDSEGDERGAA